MKGQYQRTKATEDNPVGGQSSLGKIILTIIFSSCNSFDKAGSCRLQVDEASVTEVTCTNLALSRLRKQSNTAL